MIIAPPLAPFAQIDWTPANGIRALDQTRLPGAEAFLDLEAVAEVADAIRRLVIRGAPLIGIAGAMGVAGEAWRVAAGAGSADAVRHAALAAADVLVGTRPTAVNLPWAIHRMRQAIAASADEPDARELAERLRAEAQLIWEEDAVMCAAIGAHGQALLPDGAVVHTHCNAGALATGGIGTALAPVYAAHAAGRRVSVIVDETRPLLQGSRLTAWELRRSRIPVHLIADVAAASRLQQGDVTCVIVGADRIARNGDVANKIGTFGLALAARAAGVPFYVAAPISTLDLETATGAEIVIEQRARDEVVRCGNAVTAPDDVEVWNPAFDVTPAACITGIITDRGIVAPSGIHAFAS